MSLDQSDTSVTELEIPTALRTIVFIDSNCVSAILDLEVLTSRLRLTGVPRQCSTVLEVTVTEYIASRSCHRSNSCHRRSEHCS
jgi:hypothetical protein